MTFHWATFIFQAVNFVVLVAVLWRILWTPLRRHMKERADRIAVGLAEISTGRDEIANLKDETQKLLEAARTAKADAMRQAEMEGNTRRVEMLETARRAAAGERDRMLVQVAGEQQRREQEFLRSLAPLVGHVLERLLLEFSGPKLHELACERFADWLDAMPAEERARLSAAAAEERPIDVTSANEELPSRVQAAIRSVVSVNDLPSVHTDPRLIAGVRLRVGETVIDGSLNAQIAQMMDQVSQREDL
jgi:F-type H+-transporting ATPase subunit b